MARTLLSLAALLGVGLALALWLGSDRSPGGAPSPPAGPAASSPSGAERTAPAKVPAPNAAVPLESEEAAGRRAAVGSAAGPAVELDGTTPVIRGRIVVHGPGGRSEAESGTVTAVLWGVNVGSTAEIEVVDGRFEHRLDQGALPEQITLVRGMLGGRPVMGLRGGGASGTNHPAEGAREGDDWLLEGVWLEAPTLRVLASESGEDLGQVWLHRLPEHARYSPGSVAHPGPVGRRSELLDGPFSSPRRFEPDARTVEMGSLLATVGAPGRAWKRLEVDFGRTGTVDETVVELERAGSLAVTVTGVPAAGDLHLRLLHTGAPSPAVALVHEERLEADLRREFDGLTPGSWEVRAQRGANWWTAASFGTAAVTIAADERSEVSLVVTSDAARRAEEHPTAVEVRLAAAWGKGQVRWRLVRLSARDGEAYDRFLTTALAPVDEASEVLVGRFERDLKAGEYGLHAEQLGVLLFFSVAGPGEHQLSVGAPAPIAVELVDAGSGAPLGGAHVFWFPEAAQRLDGVTVVGLAAEPGEAVYRGRGLPGRIVVSAAVDGYVWGSESFDVAADGGQFRLELTRAMQVFVRFFSEGREIDWRPGSASEVFERLEGAGPPSESGGLVLRGNRVVKTFDAPGRFRLVPPRIDGYLPADPVEFELLTGEERTVDVHYVRRP